MSKKKGWRSFAWRCALVVSLAGTMFAQPVNEYAVKAAFLYNFARFVQWPPQTFDNDAASMSICVLGKNPFGQALEDALGGKTVSGRSLLITDIKEASQAAGCQILFVTSSERKRLRPILAELRTVGLLTVGECAGFASQGGVVNFRVDDGRVRFEINAEAAAAAKLRISPSVLQLAQLVKTGSQ